jgi:hypothetical protein
MKRLAFSVTAAAALMFVLGLSGCKKPETDTEPTDAPSETAEAGDGHTHEEGHEHTDIEVALAKLTPEERASAEAQKICPVSDHELGSMDKPLQVTLADDTKVWICCAGCEEELKKNPDKYLAKLDSKE